MTRKLVSLCTFLWLAAAPGFAAERNRSYVPKPVPVRSDLDIAAFYYPGTDQMAEWDMVETTLPKIKPLLGWYDEGNPEVIDWQIKWAVEHGIGTLFVDEMFKRPYTKENVQESKDEGFRETTTYNYSHVAWWHSKDKETKGTKNHFSYQCVEETVAKSWKEQADAGVLPCIPVVPTGWNDQPRSFQKATVIYGRTPERFRAICEQARDFCREYGIKKIVLGPLNEWQEGSYLEPNEEYGFAMYDAVRDVFCKKPEQGWPANITPKELGLGPYDYPPMVHPAQTAWNFDGSTEGWYRQPYGAAVLRVRDGCLRLVTTRDDRTAMRIKIAPFLASEYRSFIVRMRVGSADAGGSQTARLYWGTDRSALVQNLILQEDKTATLPVRADGVFHEYVFSVKDSANWKDRIVELWFDPINRKNAVVDIDWMKFSE